MAVLLRDLGGGGADDHDSAKRAKDQNESDIVMLKMEPWMPTCQDRDGYAPVMRVGRLGQSLH